MNAGLLLKENHLVETLYSLFTELTSYFLYPVGLRMIKSHSKEQAHKSDWFPVSANCLLYALLSLVVNGIIKTAEVCP